MKKLLATARLSAIIALLAVSSAEGQQPPEPQPGTPATPQSTTSPQSSTPPQSTPAPQTTQAQPARQTQNDSTAKPPSLYGPWSIGAFYWITSTSAELRSGVAATAPGNLDYPGHGKYTPGVSLSFPVSKTGMLNLSGFVSKGSTGSTLTQSQVLLGTTYAAGDFVSSNYTIKNIKVSLQDLFFPFPRKDAQKWRIKTLWELQYASMKTNLSAPLAPTTGSAASTVPNTASGTRYVVYPTFGLAAEYHLARNLMVEARGSGFAIPHHSTIGDAEGSLAYRFGAAELVIGERYFHFKTSAQNSEYFRATLLGPYAALRLYPGQVSIPCWFCRNKTAAPPTDTSSTSPPPGTPQSSSQSANARPGSYVRRISAGATLSVLGLNLVSNATNSVATSSTVTTTYSTTGASQRIGYGVTAQLAVTDHFAVAFSGLLRRLGYQFTTTVTTSKPTVVGGVVTTVTTSTNSHEDTRARLIDVPAVVRYYNRGRHEPGTRWFFEGGGAWRKTDSIRTSISTSDASSVVTCCTSIPAHPAHASAFGIVAGAGVQLTDAFGIRIVPEVRYTRWMSPVFNSFTTTTQQNEVTAGFSITF